MQLLLRKIFNVRFNMTENTNSEESINLQKLYIILHVDLPNGYFVSLFK